MVEFENLLGAAEAKRTPKYLCSRKKGLVETSAKDYKYDIITITLESGGILKVLFGVTYLQEACLGSLIEIGSAARSTVGDNRETKQALLLSRS